MSIDIVRFIVIEKIVYSIEELYILFIPSQLNNK